MNRKHSILVIVVVALLATTVCALTSFPVQASTAQISTDKADYAPTDTVVVNGSGFLANHNVLMTLIGPAGFTTKTWNAQTDANGNLQTTYNQGLMGGTFSLQAMDGTNTATTAFTDDPSPGISISPTSWIMDVGQSKTFTTTITAAGGGAPYTYKWSVNNVDQSGQTASSFTYTPSFTGTSIPVKVTVTDSKGKTDSATASVTVNSALTISVAPASVTMDVGQVQRFTATVGGGSGSKTYQWYLAGSPISGQAGLTYDYTASGSSTSIYCKVTDSSSMPYVVQSTTASVTVNSALSATVTPGSPVLDNGQSVTLTAIPSGGTSPYTYQWWKGGSSVSGATSSAYSFSPSASTTAYVVVTDSASTHGVAISNTALVTVNSALVAPTASRLPAIVDIGQTIHLTSTAVSSGTSPYTYQWKKSSDATTFSDITGGTTKDYDLVSSSLTAGTWSFKLVVTDSTTAQVISNTVTVLVNPALVAPTASASPTTVSAGQSVSLSVPTPPTGTSPYSYDWKVSSDNGVTYNDIPSGSSSQNPSYVTVSAVNLKFEVIITDNTGAQVTSNVVPVTANQITITPSHDVHSSITPNTAQNVAYGGSKTFTYSADIGYSVSQVLVDGNPISLSTYPTSYTFSSVSQAHTIAVFTIINTFTITVTQGSHGTISPDTSTVDYGSNNHLTITPANGYHIVDVVVDTVSKGAMTSWDFNSINVAHIISASFAINTYNIAVTQTDHGSITGPSSVNWGTDAAYTIAPSDGYHIVDVVVDSVSKGAVTSTTISNVKETGHSITASFAIDIHSTTLTINVNPKTVNKYDSGVSATVSGYLKSGNTGLNNYAVKISYNDGRNLGVDGWVECTTSPATTGTDGYYTLNFPVSPDFVNGFVAFKAEFTGDPANGYAASSEVTGAVGGETGNLNVLPEYVFGGLAALGACFVGFAVFKKRSSLPKLFHI